MTPMERDLPPLERRYRRLLACYPKEHRERHEEEMVAVLLAGSAPGRDRPTVRDTLDLLRGALTIRLRHAVTGRESLGHWRDAVNIAALITPIALLIGWSLPSASTLQRIISGSYLLRDTLMVLEFCAWVLPYGLIALLAWLGRPRAAAVCAWAFMAFRGFILFDRVRDLPVDAVAGQRDGFLLVQADGVLLVTSGATSVGAIVVAMLPACLCALLLTFAPAPGPGPLGTRRLLGWTVVVSASLLAGPEVMRLWVLAVVGVGVLLALRSPVGRRTLVVLLPLMGHLAGDVTRLGTLTTLMTLATVSLLALVVPVWLARGAKAV
ncbi:hypothetical protein ACFOY2_06410 [Nonomuraea purpurea]|uniref:Uncharacterized protein n=1 Tax=Nonomuraea purpurea TaxID=1849276 RepID=A0ABV8FYK2_9ACTN